MILLIAVACGKAKAQTQGSFGAVEGHVVCTDGNFPGRGATVTLLPLASLLPKSDAPSAAALRSAENVADFDGFYSFPSVPAGVYVVDALKDGYSNDLKLVRTVLNKLTLDQQKSLLATFPQVIVSSAGTVRKDLLLHRGGAIMGRVTVDSGGTAGTSFVTATLISSNLVGQVAPDARQEQRAFSVRGPIDDRGRFRIAGLPQGKYRLSLRLTESYFTAVPGADAGVIIRPSRLGTGELTVFSPDALTEENAKLISVNDGDEVLDADLTVPLRRLHSIGGAVRKGGAPVAGVFVTVQRQGHAVQASNAISSADGSYRFDFLPADTYEVVAKYPWGTDAEPPAIKGKLSVLLGEESVVDANVELHTQAAGK